MSRVLAGRYALGDELAVGGSSRVYSALDQRLGRRVAVKLLDIARVESADPAARHRFVREARTSAGFSHPHAVEVYDAGEDCGELFLVMQYVDGPSLAELLRREGRLSIDVAVRIAVQVLSALEAAHALGVVHRDVKPANILLAGDGDAKLADFGIAKRFDDLEEALTSAGVVVGTPRYLAPEQARGEALTAATDIYAMGLVLFEMLSGAPPFPAETPTAAAARADQPAPDIAVVRPEVPAHVARAVTRALAPDPGQRFATASAMAGALSDDLVMAQTISAAGPAVAPAGSATAATASLAVHGRPATSVMRLASGQPRRARRAWPIFVAFAALAAAAAVAIAIYADDGPGTLGSPVDTQASTPAGTVAATVTAAPTTTTAPTTTAPTTTIAATTTAEPATTEPQVAELVPGFPVPDSLEEFHAQLADDPGVIGQHGRDIRNQLATLLDERSRRKQREQAERLIVDAHRWVDDDTLDADVGDTLIDLLRPLAADGDDDD